LIRLVLYTETEVSIAAIDVSATETKFIPAIDKVTATQGDDDMTMAQILTKMRSAKPKAKGVVIKEPVSVPKTPSTTISPSEKGKGLLIDEPKKKFKFQSPSQQQQQPMITDEELKRQVADLDAQEAAQKAAQILSDKEYAEKLQAQKNAELTASWFEERAQVEADCEFAKIVHKEEQDKYSVDEKARMLKEIFDAKKKKFAAQRYAAKKNKPPTQKQRRDLMCRYLFIYLFFCCKGKFILISTTPNMYIINIYSCADI
jgi:hypothetical protein